MSDLPTVSDRRLAVRITGDAERQVRGGHPWVFDGSIESISHEGSAGDLAVVFDRRRKFMAIGLYDPMSPIRIRVLHAGKPRQIDEEFWLEVLAAALDLRQSLLDDDATSGYRLLNGESDGFPGLVADRYDDVLVLKLYTAAWIPHLRVIVDLLADLVGVRSVVLRLSRALQQAPPAGLRDGAPLLGVSPTSPVRFLENGLRFEADVVAGQKTGHFLDQRDNRALVGGLAEGARVLDVFSCTGGFSVHAAAGGAREVVSVDQSRPALDGAVRNMGLNHHLATVAACRHRVIAGDAFTAMERMSAAGERFDIVVIDPPSFAPRQRDVARALAAYARLTRLGLDLVNDGDWFVQSSCSARIDAETFEVNVSESASSVGVELLDTIVTGHPIDHPVTFPEGAYLKAVFGRPRRWPTAAAASEQ